MPGASIAQGGGSGFAMFSLGFRLFSGTLHLNRIFKVKGSFPTCVPMRVWENHDPFLEDRFSLYGLLLGNLKRDHTLDNLPYTITLGKPQIKTRQYSIVF